jgi:hypothetical protein
MPTAHATKIFITWRSRQVIPEFYKLKNLGEMSQDRVVLLGMP